jgi:hypothetical protein
MTPNPESWEDECHPMQQHTHLTIKLPFLTSS